MDFSPLRRLAIRLACAHLEDREWILAQLESSDRQRIEELLQEISLLGLAADPAVVAAIMKEAQTSADPLLPGSALVYEHVVKAEHPFWGALVLQLQSQTQRREVLDALPNGPRVRRWDAAFAKQSVPPALAQSLKGYLQRPEASDGRP